MTATTIIDLQAIALTALILIFFLILAGFIVALNAVIADILERMRGRRRSA